MPHGVIVVVNDMLFESKIRASADALGTQLVIARSLKALGEKLSEMPGTPVIVDLDTEGVDVIEAIRMARTQPQP